MLFVLIDPDKIKPRRLLELIRISENSGVDGFLVGSSLLVETNFEETINTIKNYSKLPVILFPGNNMQISNKADAILFLSLISGRNPDFLIGQHVIVASILKKSKLEVISTGYILVESGSMTSVLYLSNTMPIPRDKIDIAVSTAIAGELLGLKMIYLEAGSGALKHVPAKMVSEVRRNINVPLIVGGGIRNSMIAYDLFAAGADIIVIGNSVEKKFDIIEEICEVKKKFL